MNPKDFYTADKYIDFWLGCFREATIKQIKADITTMQGASENSRFFRIANFCRKKLYQRINHLQPNRQLYK